MGACGSGVEALVFGDRVSALLGSISDETLGKIIMDNCNQVAFIAHPEHLRACGR